MLSDDTSSPNPSHENQNHAPQNIDVPELPSVSFGPHFEMHPVVFPVGALIVLALVALTLFVPNANLESSFVSIRNWIGEHVGWLYVMTMTGFVLFALWLAFSRFGRIRLSKDNSPPEFSTLSWFAMLFSAGMGIGLLFWSVAEPIYHFNATPPGFAEGFDNERIAMAVTIFHWGLHPWALYAVVGLALAYFGFRRDMPLSFRSILHPILGDRVWGFTGDAIDVLAIIATLTGVATSLGIGAQQVNAGLSFLFGTPISLPIQYFIIAGITAIATISVVTGLATGIRRLSELNIALAAVLMLIVIIGSGVIAFISSTLDNTGAYLQLLPSSSLRTGAFSEEGRNWATAWTVFYWAWWIAWSPFVGMFIARISKGRTIREFVLGTLLLPTAVSIIWMTAFGSTTLRQHQTHLEYEQKAQNTELRDSLQGEYLPEFNVAVKGADGKLLENPDGTFKTETKQLTAVEYLSSDIVTDDNTQKISTLPTVLFAMIDGIFESKLLVVIGAGIATLCIILFFVTSSDSASMVIDIIASGGNPDPPVGTRLFWAISEGLVAALLLAAGGLNALQAASIIAALPFSIILLMAAWSLFRTLTREEVPRIHQPRARKQ
ncbi:Glycine betaine transporter OpuD [Poriferisphaera corsica]|uniref:Glycine betaine transporter OpuD n=1 Tax=Poriferisphaera corsica TaxID=2528020 RepID=A0A517YXS7_9BACT|nr:BCCT family transporter [Poriferisphaera corsica]QDU35026.1 Glycine betaine transporter OpuD [Poriferisphaera corsica]